MEASDPKYLFSRTHFLGSPLFVFHRSLAEEASEGSGCMGALDLHCIMPATHGSPSGFAHDDEALARMESIELKAEESLPTE